MTLKGFSLALNLLALTPLLLTLAAAFIAWKRLARPWAFTLIGGLVTCVLAGIAWLWLVTGMAIHGEDTPAGRMVHVVGAPDGMPISVQVLIAHALVLAGGAGAFAALIPWLRKR